ELPIGGANRFEVGGDYRFVGQVTIQDNFIGALSSNQLAIPSYDRIDTRFSLTNDSGGRFTAYVQNVLNSWDYTGASSDPYQLRVFPQYGQPLAPRQYGIVFSKNF